MGAVLDMVDHQRVDRPHLATDGMDHGVHTGDLADLLHMVAGVASRSVDRHLAAAGVLLHLGADGIGEGSLLCLMRHLTTRVHTLTKRFPAGESSGLTALPLLL